MESGFVKIIECFNITGIGLITELQHNENGIPPNSKIVDLATDKVWIIKKRVYHGILILDESEKFFECETESMHLDAVFCTPEKREIAVEKERDKRMKGIYSYLIKPETNHNKKKQIPKPKIASELKIMSPN